ncbi:hypothetical protein KRX19_02365 [Cardiobacteriaceae bacterium TAE3-ERU3]|nr:hypothetical protein [Cardiobacteriaceae bacterium TAE3-ERU3]
MKQLNTKQKVCVRLIVGAIAALSISHASAETKIGSEIRNDQISSKLEEANQLSSFKNENSQFNAKLTQYKNTASANARANEINATSEVNTPAIALENNSAITNIQRSLGNTTAFSQGLTVTKVEHNSVTADVNDNQREAISTGNSADNASIVHALSINAQTGTPASKISNHQTTDNTAAIRAQSKSDMTGIKSSNAIDALVANVSDNKHSATTYANSAVNDTKVNTVSEQKNAEAKLSNNQNSKAENTSDSRITTLGAELANSTGAELNINNNKVRINATDNTASNSLFVKAGTSAAGSNLALLSQQESSNHATKASSHVDNLGISANNITSVRTLNINGNVFESAASNNLASNATTLNATTSLTAGKIGLENKQKSDSVDTDAHNTIANVLGIQADNLGGAAGTVSGNQISARVMHNSAGNELASTANSIEQLEATHKNVQEYRGDKSEAQNTVGLLGIKAGQVNNDGNVIGNNSLEALAKTNSANNRTIVTSLAGSIAGSNIRSENDQLIAAEGVTTSSNTVKYVGIVAPQNIGSNNVVTKNLVSANSLGNDSANAVTASSAGALRNNTLSISNDQMSEQSNANSLTSATNTIKGIMVFNESKLTNDSHKNTVQYNTVSSNALQNQSSNVLSAKGTELSGNRATLTNKQTVGMNRQTNASNLVSDRIGIAVLRAQDEQNVNNNELFADAKGNRANNDMSLVANAGQAEIATEALLSSTQEGHNSKVSANNDIERIGVIMQRGNGVTQNILKNNVSSLAINNLAMNKQAVSGATNLAVSAPVSLFNSQSTSDGFEAKANVRIGELLADITDGVTGNNTLTLEGNAVSSDARANYAINRSELSSGTVLNAQSNSGITNQQSTGIGSVSSTLEIGKYGISVNSQNAAGSNSFTVANNVLNSKASGNYGENILAVRSGTALNTGNNNLFIIDNNQENDAAISATLNAATSINSTNTGLNGSDSRILNNRSNVYAAGNNVVNNMVVNAGVDGNSINTKITNTQVNAGDVIARNDSSQIIRDASGSNGVASATLYGNSAMASAVGNAASISSVIRSGN